MLRSCSHILEHGKSFRDTALKSSFPSLTLKSKTLGIHLEDTEVILELTQQQYTFIEDVIREINSIIERASREHIFTYIMVHRGESLPELMQRLCPIELEERRMSVRLPIEDWPALYL